MDIGQRNDILKKVYNVGYFWIEERYSVGCIINLQTIGKKEVGWEGEVSWMELNYRDEGELHIDEAQNSEVGNEELTNFWVPVCVLVQSCFVFIYQSQPFPSGVFPEDLEF